MRRGGRTRDDGSDGSYQLLRPGVVDEPNLLGNNAHQKPVSELGGEAGPTCTVGAPQ